MLQALKQARSAFSLLNPEEVRKLAERPAGIGLVATTERGYRELEDFLAPADAPREYLYRASDEETPAKVDLVLYEPGLPCPHGAFRYDRHNPDSTIQEILHAHDDLALGLARHYPVFRPAVVERIIHLVSRENALFAVATALPNVVPNLFELPWAVGEFASDTAFLTMNQVRMAFLIAAACGGEVGFGHQKGSMLSIIGGAFGWRAVARELAGKIPLGGGLIPKGAIAYAGTYVVGKCLERYHHARKYPSRSEQEAAYHAALERGKGVAESVAGQAD